MYVIREAYGLAPMTYTSSRRSLGFVRVGRATVPAILATLAARGPSNSGTRCPMRRIAVVLLLGVTGCAAAPAEEAVEGPRIVPVAERVNEEEVQTPDDVGGGCGLPGSVGGAAGASAGGIGDGGGDDVGSWGGDACRLACTTVASVGCNSIVDACLLGELVTVGSITLPCGFGIVAACFGGAACAIECPS